jgi:peroxiredoxin
MKLHAPALAPKIALVDINGDPIMLGNGRKMLLSLFREATCPFCNFRVFELTTEEVLKFIARQPRPFRMVADPEARAHKAFGGESSLWGKLRAMMLRLPAMMRGMASVGMRGMATGNLMPADFLINEKGQIVETYYGRDAGDHIPIERLELFVARGIAARAAHA